MATRHWSDNEVREAVASYLAMLDAYHTGDRLVKMEYIRALMARIDNRTRPAVEMKFRNISAVLAEAGLDYLDGYLPAFNYQRTKLPGRVFAELERRQDLLQMLKAEADRPVSVETFRSRDLIEEAPPVAQGVRARSARQERVTPPQSIENLAAREARNGVLGRAGEESVCEHERRRLHDAGRKDLSKKVEHVALTRGDGLGYDVTSFELDGAERLIEVKTTRWAAMTPFFITPNELAVSQERAATYHLYRLYRFERDPKMFVLRGDMAKACALEPVSYRARVA
jgi:hypothetical protein